MTPSPELLRIGQFLCLQLVHGFCFVHNLELLGLQKVKHFSHKTNEVIVNKKNDIQKDCTKNRIFARLSSEHNEFKLEFYDTILSTEIIIEFNHSKIIVSVKF
jgi:hypothetical protein